MKTDLKKAFLQKYPKNGKVITRWEEATGTPFEFSSLTRATLAQFADSLSSSLARSSARQYCAKLKAVLELYTDVEELPQGWRKSLTIKDDESQHIYLNEAEISRIIAYKPDTATEAAVQQQFLLGCLTGARHSDYSTFTAANIVEGNRLVYVSKKTHVKVEMPLSEAARRIIFDDSGRFAQAYRREMSDNTFNSTIRRICDLCDIDEEIRLYRRGGFWSGKKWEAVSSHTSRRSFCTNLYLRCRDLYIVSKLAGHSSTTMTERYICCSTEALTEQALAYFSAFD